MNISTIEQALEDIKNGRMVIVVDDEDRENEGDLVMAASHVTPESMNFMVTHARGLVCVPMQSQRASELDIPQMVNKNTDPNATAFGVSVDFYLATTGISAHERCMTVRAIADPATCAGHLRRPGHIFPLEARDGGVLVRRGHTEASVDLARLAGLYPAAVICEILNEDGTMARMPQLKEFGTRHGLRIITIKDLVHYRRKMEKTVVCGADFHSPTKYGVFKGKSYLDPVSGKTHVALVKGDTTTAPEVLVRIHSECLTGDALGSIRCDCGQQLACAMEMLGKSSAGVLIYLRQEGRGIGLHSKLKAYQLQDGGQDTYEANVSLGYAPDLREYHVAAAILADLGISSVRLLTNNPDKIEGIEKFGISVVREALEIAPVVENSRYLHTKKIRFNHMLSEKMLASGCYNENL